MPWLAAAMLGLVGLVGVAILAVVVVVALKRLSNFIRSNRKHSTNNATQQPQPSRKQCECSAPQALARVEMNELEQELVVELGSCSQ